MRGYRLIAVCTALLLLLCGCAPRVTYREPASMPHIEEPAETPSPTQTPEPTLTAEQQRCGSVGLLSEPTVLACVFLNDAAHVKSWSLEQRTQAVQQVTMAVEWIGEQAANYGVFPQLYAPADAEDALCTTYNVQCAMQGGEGSEESNEFFNEMDALCATLDTDALHEQYGTDRVGFLIFLPLSGTSFTMVHYADDGESFYCEYSCLYRSDAYSDTTEPESPATYAHEILHLFGAPDLYEGSSDFIADDALTAYMLENYPDDIMVSTYEDDGSNRYDAITKTISPLTAYCLGLADTCAELDQFPQLEQWRPGVFYYDTPGDASSGQQWLDDDAVAV